MQAGINPPLTCKAEVYDPPVTARGLQVGRCQRRHGVVTQLACRLQQASTAEVQGDERAVRDGQHVEGWASI